MREITLSVLCLRSATLALFFITPTIAQAFKWKLSRETTSTSLSACDYLPIAVLPGDSGSSGIPPYYMQAFAAGGTPMSTLIETRNQVLSWRPSHPPGVTLVLSLVDSTGSAGGVDQNLYTITAGTDTQCVVNDNTSDFTVSANVTEVLPTCEPWGLRIKGGVPPYNITIASPGAPLVTNSTLVAGEDAYTYINRVPGGGYVSASVSDSKGRWAKGTLLLRSTGLSDPECPGLVSSGGKSSTLDQTGAEKAQNGTVSGPSGATDEPQEGSSSSKKTAVIVGVCVPIGALLLLGALGAWLYRHRQRQHVIKLDVHPRQFEERETHVLSISGVTGANSKHNPSTTSFHDDYVSAILEPNRHLTSPTLSRSVYKSTSTAATINEEEEAVVQHRDAGDVRELPPPYVDRGKGSEPAL